MKTYKEAIQFKYFEDRFKYLMIGGVVGDQTFGGHRQLNQVLYSSAEWKNFRRDIIIRDNGCDLAHLEYPIEGRRLLIHHINPITVEQVIRRDPLIFDPDNVICVSHQTHEALHYRDERYLKTLVYNERRPNDTTPWR